MFDYHTLDGVINCGMLMIFTHFIADFVFQTRQMGENKSHSFWWLSVHVHTYYVVSSIFYFFILPPIVLIIFVVVNFWLHFLTDFSTSKLTSFFYKKAEIARINLDEDGRKKWMSLFWLTIGTDQTIHGFCLFLTFKYLIMNELAADLHKHVTSLPLFLQIIIITVFVGMFIWTASVFIKLILNMFGISFKKKNNKLTNSTN